MRRRGSRLRTVGIKPFIITVYANPTFKVPFWFGSGTQRITSIEHDITIVHDGTFTNTILSFSSAGEYDIEIWGNENDKTAFNFYTQSSDASRLRDIKQWGTALWHKTNLIFRFTNGFNSILSYTDAPRFPKDTDFIFASTFRDSNFNGKMNDWETNGRLVSLDACFYLNNLFNQDISGWNVTGLTGNAGNLFLSRSLAYSFLDNVYNAWSQQNVQTGVSIHFGVNSKYTSEGQAGRDILTGTFGWIITDGGLI